MYLLLFLFFNFFNVPVAALRRGTEGQVVAGDGQLMGR